MRTLCLKCNNTGMVESWFLRWKSVPCGPATGERQSPEPPVQHVKPVPSEASGRMAAERLEGEVFEVEVVSGMSRCPCRLKHLPGHPQRRPVRQKRPKEPEPALVGSPPRIKHRPSADWKMRQAGERDE